MTQVLPVASSPLTKPLIHAAAISFWHTWLDRSPLMIPHLLVSVAVSKSHLYKWTWCLTVAVVVVLHYLHLTNASTTFSPFIFKYCWHIWRFYVLLFLLSSFFMSYDNVMMCIFFLLIKLYSNQVCFCPFTLCGFPEGTWEVVVSKPTVLVYFAPVLYLGTAFWSDPPSHLALSSWSSDLDQCPSPAHL